MLDLLIAIRLIRLINEKYTHLACMVKIDDRKQSVMEKNVLIAFKLIKANYG